MRLVRNGCHATIDASSNVTATKYYYFGAQRIATQNAQGVFYLHSDHLGSTSVVVAQNPNLNQSLGFVSRQTYYPFGVVRTSEGASPTD